MKARASLLRLHKFRVDERQREVSRIAAAVHALEDDIKQLDASVTEERETAENLEGGGAQFARYCEAARARRAEMEHLLQELDRELYAAHASLSDAFREFKKYEHLEALRLAEEKRAADRRERGEMDEIAIRRASRRRDNT